MFEPQSPLVFAFLAVAFGALMWWMLSTRLLVLRVLGAAIAFLAAVLFGVLAVNKYYDYYPTWGSAIADLTSQSGIPHLGRGQPADAHAGAASGVHADPFADRPAQPHHEEGARVPAAAVLPAGVRQLPVSRDRAHPRLAR
jgi:hypothetical protein